jgi:hypothetical protein
MEKGVLITPFFVPLNIQLKYETIVFIGVLYAFAGLLCTNLFIYA